MSDTIRLGQLRRRPLPGGGGTVIDYLIIRNKGRDYMNDYREDVWEGLALAVAVEGLHPERASIGAVITAAGSNWEELSTLIAEAGGTNEERPNPVCLQPRSR